jgi:hypothetical protein
MMEENPDSGFSQPGISVRIFEVLSGPRESQSGDFLILYVLERRTIMQKQNSLQIAWNVISVLIIITLLAVLICGGWFLTGTPSFGNPFAEDPVKTGVQQTLQAGYTATPGPTNTQTVDQKVKATIAAMTKTSTGTALPPTPTQFKTPAPTFTPGKPANTAAPAAYTFLTSGEQFDVLGKAKTWTNVAGQCVIVQAWDGSNVMSTKHYVICEIASLTLTSVRGSFFVANVTDVNAFMVRFREMAVEAAKNGNHQLPELIYVGLNGPVPSGMTWLKP